jgi:S-adenosylmethionine decarboxylase
MADVQALFQSETFASDGAPGSTAREVPKDYFIERDGARYAGTHLIVDLWGAERLDDLAHVEATLRDAVTAAKATLLHIHLHHFTPNQGISGVAVLAESQDRKSVV